MSIGELADAAGVTRRAVRFYVHRGLLPAPHGLGRGRHYDSTHLERLKRISELQAAGHSLEAIKVVLEGGPSEDPTPPARAVRARRLVAAELWTRLKIADGVELHVDVARHDTNVEELLAVRDVVRSILGRRPADRDDD
jgi:DNA-binding transcriptional MerR regulator